jgi:hypothetical protein
LPVRTWRWKPLMRTPANTRASGADRFKVEMQLSQVG